ncbi:MAG: helix-turn-helix domain-containing protein [Pseudomonadota bacterium]
MPARTEIRSDLYTSGELKLMARTEKVPRKARRLLAIAHAMNGMTFTAAAEAVGMERQALGDAVKRYNAEGLDGRAVQRSSLAAVSQQPIEVESIVPEGVGNVGLAVGAQDVESKAAGSGEDAGVDANTACVFAHGDIAHIMVLIFDPPMPAYRACRFASADFR